MSFPVPKSYDINDDNGTTITYDNGAELDLMPVPEEGGGGGSVTVDDELSSTSENPVQNKVIYTALNGKAGTDVATTNANGLMSSTDKTRLDAVYADYSSAITALGV